MFAILAFTVATTLAPGATELPQNPLQTEAHRQEPNPPKFMGHDPLPGSFQRLSFAETDRWLYCFEGDFEEVARATKKDFGALGYKPDKTMREEYRQSKQYPSWRRHYEWWMNNSICLRTGTHIVMSVTIIETSVTVVKDCKIDLARDWVNLGPRTKRTPGWITVILARPKKGSMWDR